MRRLIVKIFYRIQRIRVRLNLEYNLRSKILQIGKHTYGAINLTIDVYTGSESKVIIGKYCSISKHVRIITGGIHPSNWVSTYPFRAQWDLPGKFKDGMPYTKGDVKVGNDVWIGTGVTILSGVKIGHGAVLAACSVITKDVAPYAIVGGNPARLIRYRFGKERINELLEMAWWDWTEQRVKKSISFLNAPLNK